MSDSRRVYTAIRAAVKQLYPHEPQGNLARHLNTLAALTTGIVLNKTTHLPKIASKLPGPTKPESRVKQFGRWMQNDAISSQVYFLPFVEELLTGLAGLRTLVLVMDGSEVGRGCLALLLSVLYQGRALPLAWVVVKGSKGHFPAPDARGAVGTGDPAVASGDGGGVSGRWRVRWHQLAGGGGGRGLCLCLSHRPQHSGLSRRRVATRAGDRCGEGGMHHVERGGLYPGELWSGPGHRLVGGGLCRAPLPGDQSRLGRGGMWLVSQTRPHRDLLL